MEMPNSSTRAALPAAASAPEYTAAGATLASNTPKSVTNAAFNAGRHDAPLRQPQHAGEQPERGEQQRRVRPGIADRNRQRRQQQHRAEKECEPARRASAGSTRAPARSAREPPARPSWAGFASPQSRPPTWRIRRRPPVRAPLRCATHSEIVPRDCPIRAATVSGADACPGAALTFSRALSSRALTARKPPRASVARRP